jgi:hypothetical protein
MVLRSAGTLENYYLRDGETLLRYLALKMKILALAVGG